MAGQPIDAGCPATARLERVSLAYRHPAARLGSLLLLCALASCGGQRLTSSGSYPHYSAPGSANDPWGPFIKEASGRYGVPERWIREVMRQESGGRQYLRGQPITSDAGAAGLMQLMPATYEELRGRYGLGNDPYDPHDNIMAGTAYIGELYKNYGSPAFLAAYNAGPHRLEAYMAGGAGLPNQTVDYLASIAPRLGSERPMSGPLAAYADGGQAIEVAQAQPEPSRLVQSEPAQDRPYAEAAPLLRSPSAYVPHEFVRPPRPGCWQDPNAAYDPDAPCGAAPGDNAAEAPQMADGGAPPPARLPGSATVPGATLWGSNPAPPQPPASSFAARALPPPRFASSPPTRTHFAFIPSAAASTMRQAGAPGDWAVQVGAFSNQDLARSVAEAARSKAPRELVGTRTVLGATTPFGGQVLYRARLIGLSANTASAACGELAALGMACVTVPPGG